MFPTLTISILLALSLITHIMAQPGEGYSETKSGIQYKIYRSSDTGQPARTGDHLRVDIIKYDENGRDLFNTRTLGQEGGVEVKLKDPEYNGDIMEMFGFMAPGDSAEAWVRMDSVDREFMKDKDRGRWYRYELFLYASLDPETYRREMEKHEEDLLREQCKAFKKFARKVDYRSKVVPAKGLVALVLDKGGEPLVQGMPVRVHYTGSLLDGTVFDSSIERDEPFDFILGEGNVIQGWDMLLPELGKGAKAVLLIASKFAYGRSGAGGGIPPDTPLIFEVEILP